MKGRYVSIVVSALIVSGAVGCSEPNDFPSPPPAYLTQAASARAVSGPQTATAAALRPDLKVFVTTSLVPPLCYGLHSRYIGALVTVRNDGAGDAGPFVVEANGSHQQLADGLKAGESRQLWFDSSIFARPWTTMNVVVDPLNQVAESDEQNNTASDIVATLTPPPPCPTGTPPPADARPDLALKADFGLLPGACAEPSGGAGWRVTVTNQGQSAAGPFLVALNDVVQPVEGGLPPGGRVELWFDAPPAAGLLTFKADPADQVVESYETNNTLTLDAGPLSISPPGCVTPTP